MSKKATHEEVDVIEKELLNIEKQMREIGVKVCDIEGGVFTWNSINRALNDWREAIRETYQMRQY